MGCCLIALVGAAWPRLALVFIYFLNPAIPRSVFKTTLWPLLGFCFLPTTTLAYELCTFYRPGGMSNLFSIIIVVLAFLHDTGQFASLRSRRRD